jgi:hypothetical protein
MSPQVRGPGAPLVHRTPGVATLGHAATVTGDQTELGSIGRGVHLGLAESERENWGTRLRRRLGTGSPELAGWQR